MARIASRDLAFSLSFDDEGPKDCATGCTNKTNNKASVAGEVDLAQLHAQLAGLR
ncbi:MAG TPA: hypothetical protein VFU00_05680 [Gemmatimonadales bacterium]|nr:hypothetical protein [Gemmatimonadales bacterium]